jgi:hypothetical protein
MARTHPSGHSGEWNDRPRPLRNTSPRPGAVCTRACAARTPMNHPKPVLPGQMPPLWTPSGSEPLGERPLGQVSTPATSQARSVLPGCVQTMVPLSDEASDGTYWKLRHASMAFAGQHGSYSDYEPAYRYGTERSQTQLRTPFASAEPELRRGWSDVKGDSKLGWDAARMAVQHAWNRVQAMGMPPAAGDACSTLVDPSRSRS